VLGAIHEGNHTTLQLPGMTPCHTSDRFAAGEDTGTLHSQHVMQVLCSVLRLCLGEVSG
jgi:hypothetical protein